MVILRHTISSALLFVLSVSTATASVLGLYDEVYVFGDSFSDNGNVAAALVSLGSPRETSPYSNLDPGLVPDFPYDVSDQFSNGAVWTDMIGLQASLNGGTNYAFGGAETGPLPGVTPIPGEVSMLQQVNDFFIPSLNNGPAPNTALYVVAPVGNDIRRGLEVFGETFEAEILAGSDLATAMSAAEAAAAGTLFASVTNVAAIIGDLADEGATDFLVFGGADIGLVPAVTLLNPPQVSALATQLSLAYNALLDQVLGTLPFDVDRLDLFGLLNAIVADPNAFNLANATDPCITPNVGACLNPEDYLFWDGIHLTTSGQMILTNAIRSAVPAPATVLLIVIGIVGLGYRGRRPA